VKDHASPSINERSGFPTKPGPAGLQKQHLFSTAPFTGLDWPSPFVYGWAGWRDKAILTGIGFFIERMHRYNNLLKINELWNIREDARERWQRQKKLHEVQKMVLDIFSDMEYF